MFKRLVRNIRQKPKSTRDNIALSISALFTALIFSGWLYHAPVRHAAIEERHKPSEERNESSGFFSFFGDIGEQIAGLKKAVVVDDSNTIDSLIIDVELPTHSSTTTYYKATATSSDKYTWPTETSKSETVATSGKKDVGKEVRIITIGETDPPTDGQ